MNGYTYSTTQQEQGERQTMTTQAWLPMGVLKQVSPESIPGRGGEVWLRLDFRASHTTTVIFAKGDLGTGTHDTRCGCRGDR